MTLRWHFLWSLLSAGGVFLAARELGGSTAEAAGYAAFAFIVYWLTLVGR